MPESLVIAAIAGIIVVSIAALAAGWNQIDEFLKRRAGKEAERTVGPQPFEIKFSKEYLTRHDFDAHSAEDVRQFGELKASLGELRTERKFDNGLTHEKINKVDREVGGIQKGMELQNQQLARIESNLVQVLRKS